MVQEEILWIAVGTHKYLNRFSPSAMFSWRRVLQRSRSSICLSRSRSVRLSINLVYMITSSIIPWITKFSQIMCYINISDEFWFQGRWSAFVTLAAIFVIILVYKITQVLLYPGSCKFYRLCVILISQMSSGLSDLDLLFWPWQPFLSWPLCTR